MNRRHWQVIAALIAAAGSGVWLSRLPPPATPPDAIQRALRPDTDARFPRVFGPQPLTFPRDHGAHPRFRHEWWYVTGQLQDPGGTWRGFQLTFFRYALREEPAISPSRWRADQWLLAHFAISDPATGRFDTAMQQARVGLGIASASEGTADLQIDEWHLTRTPDGERWTLTAAQGSNHLALTLDAVKPLALQGERGYSPKSADPGNASIYYSVPRLVAHGTLALAGREFPVEGTAWLDHEWGSSGLGAHQQGWDWFALQLDDGRDLTFYRLRGQDGTTAPQSRGLLVAADGAPTLLGATGVKMTPKRTWRSPKTGRRYPVAWQVSVPGQELELTLEPLLKAQEWAEPLRYWEGAVLVRSGEGAAARTLGRGYLELTGY